MGLSVSEGKYVEKLDGDSKSIDVDWKGSSKITDYFKFEIDVSLRIIGLTKVELNQEGKKIKTNKGNVEISIKGILVRDYQGKFESTPFRKFLRSIYEKWVITSKIDQYEDQLAGDCNEFLSQAKAYLDLEGRR
jgi:hypothetical protein